MMGDNRDSNHVILRDLPLGAAIVCDNISYEGLCQAGMKYHCEGGNFDQRDSVTDETFIHLIVSKPAIYSRPDRVGFVYLLSCKAIDLDAKDRTGNTALHKVVRQRGTFRMIACLLRCGADPLVKNSEGKTAEEILRTEQTDGWEENLHWLQKFLPGLFHAVLTNEPDMLLVERLLKSWCRLCKVINGEVRWLKCLAHKHACSLRIVMLLEKYENTIELALASLAGKTAIIQNWRKEDIMKNMDINARDSSYQYGYPDYPCSPRPLLAAVWETNNYDMIAELMKMEPDLSVPFRFEPEAHQKAKPLFFYVIDPKIRPEDELIIRRILQDSDLDARNTLGQTILFEAIQHNVSEALFSFMLKRGCDAAARDRYGRTARDYSQELDRPQYMTLIDEHVGHLVRDCNIRCLENLILKGYDHINDLEVVRKRRSSAGNNSGGGGGGRGGNGGGVGGVGDSRIVSSYLSSSGSPSQSQHKDSRQLEELLSDASKMQEHVKKMFEAVKSSSTLCPRKLLSKKYMTAQDKGGRTVLHHAIEQRRRKLVETIVKEFPQIINIPNNMGQTPLHYAHLFMFTDDTVDYIISKGASMDTKDVEGWTPADYMRRSIGVHAHEQMQQRVKDLELDLFLSATNFDVAFLQAIRDGDKRRVEALAIRLRDHGGMQRFNNALFECLDSGSEDIACMLIKLGFSTEVYKQYEMCLPDDPMCAMMECSHAMTSFRQRAEQVNAMRVLQLMADIARGKVKLKGSGCCMARCIRPSLYTVTLAQS